MDRVIVGAHFEKEVLRALRGRPALPVGEQAAADPLPPPRRIDGEQQQFALRPSDAHRRKAARRLPVPRDDDTRRRQGEEGEKLDRKSVAEGKSVSVGVGLGGGRILKNKKEN